MRRQPGRLPFGAFAVWALAVFFVCLGGFPLCPAQGAGAPERAAVFPCDYEGGGRFTAVAVDPKDPRTFFVGSDVAGVFKTTDGGAGFRLKGEGLAGFAVADIAIHPSDHDRVFLLTQDGLYGSRNGGESWQRESSTVRYESRLFGTHLMVFFKDALWVAADRNGVYQIRADLSPWQAVPVPGLEKTKVNALTVFRGELYAATDRGVSHLTDGGWRSCSDGLPADRSNVTDIASHPQGRMYLVEKTGGLYSWNEAGKKWEGRGFSLWQLATQRQIAFNALAVHPENPDTVFLATHPDAWPHCLYKTTDAGKSWKKVSSFQLDLHAAEGFARSLNAVEKIVFSPSDPKSVLLTDWLNVWQSRDEGESWTQLHKGLQNTVVNAVAVHPSENRTIYLAVADNGLIVSEDGGKSWKRRMSGVPDGHAQSVQMSRKVPSVVYLLMNPWQKKGRVYVYRSADGGRSWVDAGFPVPREPLPRLPHVDGLSTVLVLDPASEDIVYVGTNGYGIFKTTNGGHTWKAVNRGIASPFLKGPGALLIDPRNSQVLYASTQGGGVCKSTDGGETWTAVSGNHTFTFGMAMAPDNPSRLFAACPEKKVIVTEDGGKTWREVFLPGDRPAHIASFAVAVHPSNPKLVAVGTLAYQGAADGLYLSRDGGGTFAKLELGRDLPSVNVLYLEPYNDSDPGFYIGFNGIGAYRCVIPRAAE